MGISLRIGREGEGLEATKEELVGTRGQGRKI